MNINVATKDVIEGYVSQSHAGAIDFASFATKLAAADVESSHADYRRSETTYYFTDGNSLVLKLSPPSVTIADTLDILAIQQAVNGAQRGEVNYIEFMSRTMRAGCIGYIVWIAGQHVQYLGRRGEVHTERFPSNI